MRRRTAAIAGSIVIVAGLLLSACSGSTTPTPSPSSSSAAASSTPSASATGSSAVTWLCNPDEQTSSEDPCVTSLSTTTYSPKLRKTGTSTPAAVTSDTRPACFYVYPTVSEQTTTYSDTTVEQAEETAAKVQAARWSQLCDVYAPMYRQLTLSALSKQDDSALADPSTLFAPGIADVGTAFRQFLSTVAVNRPYIVLAHSQGSFIMRKVLAETVDQDADARSRMLSAILPGGNILVKRGSKVGGDFQNIPGCTTKAQTGCVIGYSTFGYVPDSTIWGESTVSGDTVLCTNPAKLDGTGVASPIYSAGELSSLPKTSSTWLSVPGQFTAACKSNPDVLLLHARKGSRVPDPTSVQSWGLHDLDANMFLGNLLRIARAELGSYAG